MTTPLEASGHPSVFLSNLHHAYGRTDGTYAIPNSREGDLLKQARREVEELRAALQPFAHYAEMRMAKPFRLLDDEIQTIHTGSQWEATLRFSDCKRAAKVLRSST